jgi:adenine-specific DNA-methyltransferase
LREDHLVVADFFAHARDRFLLGSLTDATQRYDAIIGNPPFVRYQNFPEEQRSAAFEIMRQAGLNPNRLTNAWAPFLVASTFLLEDEGRLGMVIPAELFQVNYAAEIRRFLSDQYNRIAIVTFKKLVFPDILQEVVLLLCERGGNGPPGIRVVEAAAAEDLAALDQRAVDALPLKPINHSTEKWTQYFLDTDEILLLRRLLDSGDLTPAHRVMDVDVGVVTGENRFFVLGGEQARQLAAREYCVPVVTRTSHLPGVIFTAEDWRANESRGYPTHLLNLSGVAQHALPEPLKAYLKTGEEQGIPRQYKCSIRKRWHDVPSVSVPDAFILRQVHTYPKITLNAAGATSTDTIHRVRMKNKTDGKTVAAAFLNSLTFAFAEVMGRSYGGGVLTFEPSESEMLPLPLRCAERLDFDAIDAHLRAGRIDDVLDYTDPILLGEGLGLSAREARALRGIWHKLKARRMGRNGDRGNHASSTA